VPFVSHTIYGEHVHEMLQCQQGDPQSSFYLKSGLCSSPYRSGILDKNFLQNERELSQPLTT